MSDRRLLSVLLHSVTAWRAYQAALVEQADAEARLAGLTVQVLPGGVRRYHDPGLDDLAAHRVRRPYPGVRHAQHVAKTGSWSTPTLTAAEGWSR